MDGLTSGDVALLRDNEGFGNSGFFWVFALLLLAGGGFGGFGGYGRGEFGQYATAASQQEILFGQQFQNIGSMINKVGDGIASLGYDQLGQMSDIKSKIADCCCATQRSIDSVKFDLANYSAVTNANIAEQTQKVLDAITTNKMADMQNQINQLQLQAALCGVVRYPNMISYNAGTSPFCGSNNGCGCGTL